MYSSIEESALHPIKMRLDIYGSGNFGAGVPFPNEFIDDALSQNILWQAYEEPITVEALASSCKVPAYYIEDSLKKLKKRGALIEPSRGKNIRPIFRSFRIATEYGFAKSYPS